MKDNPITSGDVMATHQDWTTGYEVLLYDACPACGNLSYFRRNFCPRCGASPVEVLKSNRQGVVYAVTAVVRAPASEWKAIAPYGLVLVDLDEGLRVMAHGSAGLSIGDRVEIGFRRLSDRLIPFAGLSFQEKNKSKTKL